ncbi:hypothetical protein [Arthrospira platensis]
MAPVSLINPPPKPESGWCVSLQLSVFIGIFWSDAPYGNRGDIM